MKSFEELAVQEYDNNKKLNDKYRIDDSAYLDWMRKGAEIANRWIPINEELPPQETYFSADGENEWYREYFVKGRYDLYPEFGEFVKVVPYVADDETDTWSFSPIKDFTIEYWRRIEIF